MARLMEFSNEIIGLFMIGAMLFAIFIGFPISFTLIFLGVVFGAWGFGVKLTVFLMTLQFYNSMMEQTLAAVPLFVFMGFMMEQAGLMERLFAAIQMMLARMKGSLYLAVLFVSVVFGAATGIVGASVTILGIMAAKTMNRSGYDVRLAAGTITAGGTLGILIPPSIMLVVMGPVLEIPVTDLFAAAIFPGILMAGLYVIYALGRCWINPKLGPPLPEDMIPENRSIIWKELFFGLVPPTILIAFALGSILAGWATPTEGAGMGAFGSILLAIGYRKFTWAGLYDALIKTLEISVLILFLVAASNFFGAVFSRLGTPTMITELLLNLDVSASVVVILILALVFVLGWPLEWVPIVLIILPILSPVLLELQVDMLWFAILVAVCLQTAWLSPPVALSAYFLKGVVPEWDLKDIYFGMMQFMVIQILGLSLVFLFPAIATWLPIYIYGGG
ncbi:TRAP-type C4-dicarboxylate transport system, large permease component [Litoreibacter arenae DSM 19593]|uniref:TRAP-type C4-dicarboxylate transport system, large permease component n=1 Tax=Litoreibacter arenae DSM 19593 TaxID=1123360 RepID=S9QK40_9RHOB|nr:TRAP-type C4-dicarboxylate transport system, large permease component [Litoreibacter arenae DSM 19593]